MKLEHINITVPDPRASADTLCGIFGWHIRWQGAAKDNGFTVHVGDDVSYLALYAPDKQLEQSGDSYGRVGGLNHIGVIVDDIRAAELRVIDAGYEPHSHADYEPGERFYFDGPDGMEFEVISYPKVS